ncbi:unnamed protein product [Lepidochelys olivacea]
MDPAVLGMAALQGRLGPKLVSHCRTHRDPSPDRSSLAAENQIQCAEVTRAGTDQ